MEDQGEDAEVVPVSASRPQTRQGGEAASAGSRPLTRVSQEDGSRPSTRMSVDAVALQEQLMLKRADAAQLQDKIDAVTAERDEIQRTCLVGVEAAARHMAWLRSQLQALQPKAKVNVQEEAATPAPGRPKVPKLALPLGGGDSPIHQAPSEPVLVDLEHEKSRRKVLETEARLLRHQLLKWKHEAELLEAEAPKREAELERQRADLMHLSDVLESTRQVIKHMEVERGATTTHGSNNWGETASTQTVGTRSSSEIVAERKVREKTEGRNAKLASKAHKIAQVLAAQRLLIDRLEKQLLKEEGLLEQKDLQLAGEEQLEKKLKASMRRRSDKIVVAALLGRSAKTSNRSASVPPGLEEQEAGQLPPI